MPEPLIQLKEVEGLPTVRIISAEGDLDEASIQELSEMVDQISLIPDLKFVVLDFQNISFINSKGLGYIVIIHNHLASLNQEVILTGKNDFLTDLINMVGIVKMIPYFPTLQEALLKIKNGEPLVVPIQE